MLTNDGPDTILLPNMIRTSSKRFFTADRELAGIHEVAEELPALRMQSQQMQIGSIQPTDDVPVGTS